MSVAHDFASPPNLDPLAAAEFAVLTAATGPQLLAEVAGVAAPGPADLSRWRRMADPPLVAAALRIVATRRQAAPKFSRGGRMWLSARGLEQSTGEVVARHKASRLTDSGPDATVVDLCSGIGGDAIALARLGEVIAVDLDPAMAARLSWNASVYEVADKIMVRQAAAEAVTIPPAAWLHVDPDRRVASTRKTNAVADYAPPVEQLRQWTRSLRGGAIKLGPASDFARHFDGPDYEVEIVSLRGECKEATVWFGDRTQAGVRRRATLLPSGLTWTDRDQAGSGARAQERPPPRGAGLDSWVFDPDPALIRAGLLGGFAAAHGWSRFEPGIDLLTGPDRSTSPFVSAFEVLDQFPLDLKVLRREVATRGLGPLEIKTRGLATRPESYRAQLRPAGANPATWILVGSRIGPGRAILARRAPNDRPVEIFRTTLEP